MRRISSKLRKFLSPGTVWFAHGPKHDPSDPDSLHVSRQPRPATCAIMMLAAVSFLSATNPGTVAAAEAGEARVSGPAKSGDGHGHVHVSAPTKLDGNGAAIPPSGPSAPSAPTCCPCGAALPGRRDEPEPHREHQEDGACPGGEGGEGAAGGCAGHEHPEGKCSHGHDHHHHHRHHNHRHNHHHGHAPRPPGP
jgi:hypothetical protein